MKVQALPVQNGVLGASFHHVDLKGKKAEVTSHCLIGRNLNRAGAQQENNFLLTVLSLKASRTLDLCQNYLCREKKFQCALFLNFCPPKNKRRKKRESSNVSAGKILKPW